MILRPLSILLFIIKNLAGSSKKKIFAKNVIRQGKISDCATARQSPESKF